MLAGKNASFLQLIRCRSLAQEYDPATANHTDIGQCRNLLQQCACFINVQTYIRLWIDKPNTALITITPVCSCDHSHSSCYLCCYHRQQCNVIVAPSAEYLLCVFLIATGRLRPSGPKKQMNKKKPSGHWYMNEY